MLFDPGQQVSIQVIILFNREKQKSQILTCFCISADSFCHVMPISKNVYAFKTSVCGIKPALLFLWFGDISFLINILWHICGKEIGSTTTFTPTKIKQIKEKPLVIFGYSLLPCTCHINECWQLMLCWQNQRLRGGLLMKHPKRRVLLKSWVNCSYLQIPSQLFRKQDHHRAV